MALYREEDGNIWRDYKLTGGVEIYQTEKALIEIVPSKDYGHMFFLDGELELAQKDEYIYHEMLVHPAMSSQQTPETVCILGGGDGCAIRELLTWPSVKHIDLYDWDRELVDLFSNQYRSWNTHSLSSPKVSVHIQNVLDFVPETKYDVVIIDLVDPNYDSIESRTLWTKLIPKLPSLLKHTSSLVINGGGIKPWDTKNVDWLLMLLATTFQSNESHTLQVYKTFVPSFTTDWCFFFIQPNNVQVYPDSIEKNRSIRYMGNPAWCLATNWTKDYEGRLPLKPVKLSGYLPPL